MPKNNYVISLKKAHDNKPRTRRANYAIREIYDFLKKHTRKERNDILLSEEVNNTIWKNSIQRPPRKIEVSLKFKDDKVYVFLKDSQAYNEFGKSEKPKETKTTTKNKSKETNEVVEEDKTEAKVETKEKIEETKAEVKKPVEEAKVETKEKIEKTKAETTDKKEEVKEEKE